MTDDLLLAYLDQTAPRDISHAAFNEYLKGCNPAPAGAPSAPTAEPQPTVVAHATGVLPPIPGGSADAIYGSSSF